MPRKQKSHPPSKNPPRACGCRAIADEPPGLRRDAVSNHLLNGETIDHIDFKSPIDQDVNPYTMYTLVMRSGRRFTISQCWGEINFSELVQR